MKAVLTFKRFGRYYDTVKAFRCREHMDNYLNKVESGAFTKLIGIRYID